MDINIQDLLHDLFAETHEKVITNLRNNSSNYNKLIKKHAKDSQRFENILESICEEDKVFCTSYKEEGFYLRWEEKEAIYYQGYRDCYQILKCLGALD